LATPQVWVVVAVRMIGRERRLHASSNTITSISEYSSVGGVSATPAQAQDVDIFYESKAEPRELWEINDDVVTYKDCEPFSPNPNGHGNGKRRRSGAKQKDEKYDLFLSHLQRNGQDAVIADVLAAGPPWHQDFH